jgi:hypothetical protein
MPTLLGYPQHWDYFFHKEGTQNGGNRYATVLLYLSQWEEGGETVRRLGPLHCTLCAPWALGNPQCGSAGQGRAGLCGHG